MGGPSGPALPGWAEPGGPALPGLLRCQGAGFAVGGVADDAVVLVGLDQAGADFLETVGDVEGDGGLVEDGAGGWIRSVRFYGSPISGTNKVLVLEVLLQSTEKADLAITTPEIDF